MAIIANNPISRYSYELLDRYEAGLVLSGAEVKSAKGGRLRLKGSYATIDGGEAWLVGCYIAPYAPASGHQRGYDPEQRRKLLLHRRELRELIGKSKQQGLTIIPTSVYTSRRLIKVSLALAKGKTQIDKRETIRKRDVARQIARALRQK